MVDVLGGVLLNVAVDHRGLTCFKQILTRVCLVLGAGNRAANIFNNAGATGNWFFCEEAFTGS